MQKTMSVSAGTVEKVDMHRKLQQQQNEERKLAEMMIPKKKQRLYKKIMFSKKKKTQEVNNVGADYCALQVVVVFLL